MQLVALDAGSPGGIAAVTDGLPMTICSN